MYNVFIVNTTTYRATHMVGKHLDKMAAELCHWLWQPKIDGIDHAIVVVEEGSERDISLTFNIGK
jgi:hypothetical protein